MRALRSFPFRGAALLLTLAIAVSGCDSDDVTGPTQQQVPPPTGQQSSSASFNINVSTSANVVDLNAGAAQVQVEVTARRADNNASVAPNTTALLTTTAGQLSAEAGTAASVPIEFDVGGVARATLVLNAGDLTTEGVVIVRAQIEGSFGSARIQLVNVPVEAFQILDVSPSVGPPSGGTTLTISGSGFVAPAQATISGSIGNLALENVRVVSSTTIRAETPAVNLPSGQNSLTAISVENGPDAQGNAGATDTLPGSFTYTRSSVGATTLKVISISPTFGPNEGGTQVSIIGEGFGNNVQVFFSNGPLVEAQILSITPNRLEVVTPAATGPNASNSNSIVNVRVVDPVSGQNATLGGGFQYGRGGGGALFISSIAPNQDEYLGGTLVTIFGQGFEEPVAVEMGQVAQQVISVTGTEVVVRTVRVPITCANQTGPVRVTNIETNEGVAGPPFIYVPIDPVLISVDQSGPNDGDPAGGQTIEIIGLPRSFGVGFDEPVRVTIDGVPATVLSFDGIDTLRVLTPAFTGNFETETCFTSGGQGTLQLPETVNVEVTNINTGCDDTLNNAFTYDPANSSCVVAVDAAFNVSGDPGSFTANFFDRSTGNGLTYSWNFGDGTTSDIANPTNTYALPGTYTVTLTVFDGTTSDTATQDIQIPFPVGP
ncbi:MAG: IPT/TIG domain-containing protein [Acidobacteriota bacterium]